MFIFETFQGIILHDLDLHLFFLRKYLESESIFFLPNIVRGDPNDFNKLQNLTIPIFKTYPYKQNVGTKH